MERLNFNHFFYFYVVAKEGSIKLASEKLHISQPTISDQIRCLEEFFDTPLFERKSRSLILNAEGQLALKYAERVFEIGQEVTYRLRHQKGVPKTSIDIGITHFMSQYFIYETILPLLKDENTFIRFKEAERRYLLADLEEERIDIVFTDTKETPSGSINAYRVGVNRTFAVANKRYRKLKKGFPESLNEAPFFNYTSDSSLKFEIEIFFAKYGISPHQIGEADDVDLLQLVTEKGIAFTVVPEVAMKRFCKNPNVVILGELSELQTSVWGLVKKGNQDLTKQLLRRSVGRPKR